MAKDSTPLINSRSDFRWREITSILWPYRFVLAGSAILGVVVSSSQAGLPYFIKLAIDDGIVPGSLRTMAKFLALYVAVVVINASLSMVLRYVLSSFVVRLGGDLKKNLHTQVLQLPASETDRMATGSLLSIMRGDVENVSRAIAIFLPVLIQCVYLLVSVFFMVTLSVPLALTALALLTAAFLVTLIFQRRVRLQQLSASTEKGNMVASVSEYIDGLEEIRLYGRGSYVLNQFDQRQKAYSRAVAHTLRFDSIQRGILTSLTLGGFGPVLAVGALLMMEGKTTVGVVIAFFQYFARSHAVLRQILSDWMSMQGGLASLQRIAEVRKLSRLHVAQEKNVTKIETPHSIVFEHVSFAYDDKAPVLRDVSFSVPRGGHLAIVGRTGSGKSTIINLLAGLYACTEGKILINGIAVEEDTFSDIRKEIAVVNQESFLFQGTVRENIAAGIECDDQLINELADKLHFGELIKLDQMVGELGSRLSVGQRQLVMIARALARETAILVLDEVTASMDPQIEGQIVAALETLKTNHTVITIAHRLSTLKSADQIIVVEQGRLVEQGSHDELLALEGVYSRLSKMQYVSV